MPPPIARPARRWIALAGLCLAALTAFAKWGMPAPARAGETQLFTTLPILWSESADVGGIVRGEGARHWARDVLARRGGIVALDSLAGLDGRAPLLMAQPRPLSPEENIALDRWVRAGGRVLLFADPMLTAHSDYGLGDRRRPQDVVLISPLLRHWGLRLEFEDGQPFGEREVEAFGVALPVNLPGRLVAVGRDAAGGEGAGGACVFAAEGLAARCRIGRGTALVVADAALLETGESVPAGRRAEALSALFGELAGD